MPPVAYSRDGGIDDFSYNRGERQWQSEFPVPQSERQALVSELELDRE